MAKAKTTTASKKKSQNPKIVIALVAALVLLIGGSFAWLTVTLTGANKNVIKAGTLSLTLNNVDGDTTESAGITLDTDTAVPMTLTQLRAIDGYEPYSFTLRNDGTVASNYTIYLVDSTLEEGEVRIDDSKIGYALNNSADETLLSTLASTATDGVKKRVLATGTINAGDTVDLSLDLWIHKSAENDVMGQVFRGHIEITGTQTNYVAD